MPHALVTGGAGFIGSHLVERLLDEGWRVTAIDDFDPFYAAEVKRRNLAHAAAQAGFRLIEGDVAFVELPRDLDVVVHLAAKAGVRPSIEAPVAYEEANVRTTVALLEHARRVGVRQFVFASSSSVYGVNPRVPWREDDLDLRPISPYAATKLAGEGFGHVYHHLYGIRFVALRFFTVYGPRQRPDLAIHKFARLMREGKPIPFYGDGGTRRDYTFVRDTVQGIRAAMDYDRSGFEIVNLGNDRTVSLAELVATLEEAMDIRANLDRRPEQPGDVPITWADVDKARRLLGYRPETPFADGVREFVAWLDA